MPVILNKSVRRLEKIGDRMAYGRLMVVILIVAICPETILLIVARVTGHPFVGVDLLDMVRGIFVQACWRVHALAGTIACGLSGGGWLSGCHDGREYQMEPLESVGGATQ